MTLTLIAELLVGDAVVTPGGVADRETAEGEGAAELWGMAPDHDQGKDAVTGTTPLEQPARSPR